MKPITRRLVGLCFPAACRFCSLLWESTLYRWTRFFRLWKSQVADSQTTQCLTSCLQMAMQQATAQRKQQTLQVLHLNVVPSHSFWFLKSTRKRLDNFPVDGFHFFGFWKSGDSVPPTSLFFVPCVSLMFLNNRDVQQQLYVLSFSSSQPVLIQKHSMTWLLPPASVKDLLSFSFETFKRRTARASSEVLEC